MKFLYTTILSLFLILNSTAQVNLQWDTLDAGTAENINDIYFQNPDTGYIVGDNYLFKKTTDGGNTWVDLTPPNIGERPGNNGNIVGIDLHGSFNFGTSDSGLYLAWEQGYHGVVTSNDGGSYSIFPFEDSTLLCQSAGFSALPANKGNGYVNLITYGQNCNGDATFTNYYDGPFSIIVTDTSISNKPGRFTDVDADSFSLIYGHSNGYVMRYDYILSEPDSILIDTSGIVAVAYDGEGTWYASSNSGIYSLYISTDTGRTFAVDTNFPLDFHYPQINDLDFSSSDVGLAGATSNGSIGVIYSYLQGSWQSYIMEQPIRKVKLFDNGVAYGAGDKGLIVKTTRFPKTGIDETLNNRLKVYPNPTNGLLKIEGLEGFTVLDIALLDIRGSVIRQFPTNQTTLNLTAVPRGVYFLKAETEKGRLVKKVVVQ